MKFGFAALLLAAICTPAMAGTSYYFSNESYVICQRVPRYEYGWSWRTQPCGQPAGAVYYYYVPVRGDAPMRMMERPIAPSKSNSSTVIYDRDRDGPLTEPKADVKQMSASAGN